jgi:hypothetical protein
MAAALRRALRPLIRLMLANGITLPFLVELLKGLFVEVARTDFRVSADQEPTDSRLSLLTGVHRKDVRRLREAGPGALESMPESVSFGAQVVASWVSQANYLDEAGQPLALPRFSNGSGKPSFDDLVSRHSKDIRARVVLDEWLRLGVVHIDDQDRVILNTDAFVPSADSAEKVYFFARNLHDHAAAATHNLIDGGKPWFERSVFYDALSPASIEQINARAKQMGMHLLKTLNKSALESEARDAPELRSPQRFTCGIYFYSEPAEKESKR